MICTFRAAVKKRECVLAILRSATRLETTLRLSIRVLLLPLHLDVTDEKKRGLRLTLPRCPREEASSGAEL